MLPFCGYNMGDYFAHWLRVGAGADAGKLPRIYAVNWFRKDEAGKFVWPGFGDNSRVLKWIVERLEGHAEAVDTPIGRLPTADGIDVSGLTLKDGAAELLREVDPAVWREEAALIPAFYERFGDRLPKELWAQYEALLDRLRVASGLANDSKPPSVALSA
jgi:phosphoenolpyruvate carboxykinase (GTP)